MLRVVIADDSDAVRVRVRELVSEVENVAIVGEASDGSEALELVESLRPDVLILDIRMPNTNGIQTLETLRRSEATAATMVLTSFPNRQYRDRCLQAGAAYFFDKATEFERVAEVLEQLTSDGATTSLSPTGSAAG